MGAYSGYDIQFALYALLTGNAPLTALISNRVYDDVPEAVVFPYVSFGPETSESWEAVACEGRELFLQLDTWSRATNRSRLIAKQIQGAIYDAVHNQPLTVIGQTTVLMREDFSTITRDTDTFTIHGVQRIRLLTEPI